MLSLKNLALSTITLGSFAFNGLGSSAVTQGMTLTSGGEKEQEAAQQKISVEFQGGTIRDYVEVLKKQSALVNVVLEAQAEKIKMPPLSLRQVPTRAAIKLIQESASSGGYFIEVPEISKEVFVVRRIIRDSHMTSRSTSVLPVRELIEGLAEEGGKAVARFKAETILTAIDAALEVDGSTKEEKPTIRFHADSSLLIVNGTLSQIDLVKSVIHQMEKNQQKGGAGNEIEELKKQISALQAEVGELKKSLKK